MTENDTVTVPKQQYDEMVESLADKTQSTTNLVSELKDLRAKNQLTEAEAEDLKKKLAARDAAPVDTKDLTPEKIAEIASDTLRSALAERDNEVAKQSRISAMTTFLSKHKEYHPDNDQGGIKLAALERKVSQFNTASLKTESDFLTILEDATKLVGSTQVVKPLGSDPNPPAPNGGGRGTQVPEVDVDSLTPQELKIVERSFDGDKERYLKQKAKRPDYVATLLRFSVE